MATRLSDGARQALELLASGHNLTRRTFRMDDADSERHFLRPAGARIGGKTTVRQATFDAFHRKSWIAHSHTDNNVLERWVLTQAGREALAHDRAEEAFAA